MAALDANTLSRDMSSYVAYPTLLSPPLRSVSHTSAS